MRVSISTKKFQNDRFLIGFQSITGTDAVAIAESTSQLIDKWATPRNDPPRWGRTLHHPPEPLPLDSVAKSALCESVRGVVTDAASDEFRACRLTTGASTSVFVDEALLPNVVLHGKDPTHASGRFLKVWKHDPFLNGVFDLFVWGPDSFAKLIANSPDISRRFAVRVQDLA